MPRPSKRVSPNTLGGVIRAARQSQHLSLAQVAGENTAQASSHKSSVIALNHPLKSLHYLAERLNLPLDELMALAQQSRENTSEESKFKSFDEKRAQASQLLAENRPRKALEQLQDLNMSQIPPFLRWRIIALRGQCYFSLRQFQLAQQDFLSAIAILPETVPQDQSLEALSLRLHLAASSRELNQLEAARTQYNDALAMMNASTPVRFVAEAHWGLALVIFQLANNPSNYSNSGSSQSDEVKAQSKLL